MVDNVERVTSQHQATSLDGFELSIDRNAEVPIGVQLAWALRARIHDGRFKPGQRIPGLRDLADMTGLNINTVRAVYQRLEQEGLIDSQQGSGTFVDVTPRQPSGVATIVANAVREARETGVDPRDVAAALYVSQEPTQTTDTTAERRHLLRTQITALEVALGEIETEHPGVAPPPIDTRRTRGPALLGAEELERVRTRLVRRLATVQAAIDDRAQASDTATSSGAPAPAKAARRNVATKPKRPPRARASTRIAPANS
jgi:DNA-binding transcriptional regulator YhcF (GntR family)